MHLMNRNSSYKLISQAEADLIQTESRQVSETQNNRCLGFLVLKSNLSSRREIFNSQVQFKEYGTRKAIGLLLFSCEIYEEVRSWKKTNSPRNFVNLIVSVYVAGERGEKEKRKIDQRSAKQAKVDYPPY
ncbi:hypothetical protein TNCV_198831 [Trichonephila clavipes]|nr:hypothetical protein TNCV_198831 [Trichonephila clavipes]